MSDSLQPSGRWPARLLCPWDSPGKNAGVGCRVLLQGIFPTQGSNPASPPSSALAGEGFTTSTTWGFPGGSEIKNLPANAGDIGDMGLNPLHQEDPLEKEIATHSSILAWGIPRTEQPNGLQSI